MSWPERQKVAWTKAPSEPMVEVRNGRPHKHHAVPEASSSRVLERGKQLRLLAEKPLIGRKRTVRETSG
jgi:hypothetical protein